jgi:exodeoxyribonuclease VII small subunit
MSSRRLLFPAAEPGNTPEKFEELLERLEQIVSDMENAELPLDKLLESYEEGMRLVKACGNRLADAEQKVEILSRAVNASEPGKTPPAAEAADTIPVAKPEDEIRLF